MKFPVLCISLLSDDSFAVGGDIDEDGDIIDVVEYGIWNPTGSTRTNWATTLNWLDKSDFGVDKQLEKKNKIIK